MRNLLIDIADILGSKPRLVVFVLVLVYLVVVAWKGADASVLVAMLYAFGAVALLSAKRPR